MAPKGRAEGAGYVFLGKTRRGLKKGEGHGKVCKSAREDWKCKHACKKYTCNLQCTEIYRHEAYYMCFIFFGIF